MAESKHISFREPLEGFRPVGLQEMEGVKLMNRTDTKYLTDETTLLSLLKRASAAGYRVLETDGARISPYDSVYFDTPSLRMFRDHHNQHLVRQKVRTRSYVNSGATFLEIKRKNNHGRTKKKRIGIPVTQLTGFGDNPEACDYLARHSWFKADELSPSLETLFQRITLVNPDFTERLTIDTQLCFKNLRTEGETSLQNAVIIELKQDGRAASTMKGILLDLRIKPLRVSKYCIAVTLTDPEARSGRFRPKVHQIEKIIGNKLFTI